MRVLIVNPRRAGQIVRNNISANTLLAIGKHVCAKPECPCRTTWVAAQGARTMATLGMATIAEVAETPSCFKPVALLEREPHFLHARATAERYPVGTLLRVRFNWERYRAGTDPGTQAFLGCWDISVDGPN